MPTMCGDRGGFGTGTRRDLRRQDCTLWRVLLLLHVENFGHKKCCSGTAQMAWQEVLSPHQGCPRSPGWLHTRWVTPSDPQVTFSDPPVESRGKFWDFQGRLHQRT